MYIKTIVTQKPDMKKFSCIVSLRSQFSSSNRITLIFFSLPSARSLTENLIHNIGAFIYSIMARGTRFLKIDETIKNLNEFRKETEVQIRELNNIILRFMHAINQRITWYSIIHIILLKKLFNLPTFSK